jgi:hypothetical protein
MNSKEAGKPMICATPAVVAGVSPTSPHSSAAYTAATTAIGDISSIYWPLPAALFPSLIASASVMYLPFLVVP